MTLTANQYGAMIEIQRDLVRAGYRPDIAGRIAQRAAGGAVAALEAGLGKVPQTRRVLTQRVVGGGQCVRIDLGPGMEPELYIEQQKYRDRGWNLMRVEPYGMPSREVWYACPPGQVPAEQQPLILQAEVGQYDDRVYQTAADIALGRGVSRTRAYEIAQRVAIRFRNTGMGQAEGFRFPQVAPAIPLDPANRLLALPAALVYHGAGALEEVASTTLFPPVPIPGRVDKGPWKPPPSQCQWPWDIVNFARSVTASPSQVAPGFPAGFFWSPGYDADWAVQYSCSAGLPIFGGNNERAGEGHSLPPWKNSRPAWYWDWWAWVYRVITANPTPAEQWMLGLVELQGKRVPGLFAAAKGHAEPPAEILPPTYLGDGANPQPFKDYLPYLLNIATIGNAVGAYPWPGPPAMFWQAFLEFAAGYVNALILRKGKPPTELEARTMITIGLLEKWDQILDRVEAIAAKYERKEKREAMTRALAIAVIGVAAGVFTGGATLVLVGAALTTLSAYEKSKAARQMAEFAAMFEKNNPAFAAEVERVAAEMGLGKDVAAEPVVVPETKPEVPKPGGIPWGLVAAPVLILGAIAVAKG